MNVREKQTKREEKEERKQVFHGNTFYEIDFSQRRSSVWTD